MAAWKKEELVAEICEIEERISANIVKLIEDDCTLPFVARYRKQATANMPVEKLREVFQVYEEVKKLEKTIDTAITSYEKLGVLTPDLKQTLQCCHSKEEVELACAPFKTGSTKTLAARARELGLEPYALQILDGHDVNLSELQRRVSSRGDALSHSDVKKNLQNLMADVVAKDADLLKFVNQQCKHADVRIASARGKVKATKKGAADKTSSKGCDESHKFQMYFEFQCSVRHVRPHQVLAINRGEKLGYLKVKLMIPASVKANYVHYCHGRWLKHYSPEVTELVKDTIDDAYERLICPALQRKYRSQLKASAEAASASVFASNLKHLLLMPPVRGKVILGLDPGFRNGCKYAIITRTGDIVDSGVWYLVAGGGVHPSEVERQKMQAALFGHRVEIIAIGSGTACRETEAIVSAIINSGQLRSMGIKYCIVNEDGASIYSCSKEAELEMPDFDPGVRSAASIARRLQDPLAELVKTDPKHLGVGMYQHDVSKSALKTALDMTVQECVSFVGADLNSASIALLRHIAGLSDAKAAAVVEHRTKSGAFLCREQLRQLRGFGAKTYQQCAGFLRVYPTTMAPGGLARAAATESEPCATFALDAQDSCASPPPGSKGKRRQNGQRSAPPSKRRKAAEHYASDLYDATTIHPESYGLADKLLEEVGVHKKDLGQSHFIQAMTAFAKGLTPASMTRLTAELSTDEHTVQQLLSALQQKIGDDCRADFDKPLFRSAVIDIGELKPGHILSGVVKNVVDFGAFVDIGVGHDGLLHASQTRGQNLQLGLRVEVVIDSLDLPRKRIGLRLAMPR